MKIQKLFLLFFLGYIGFSCEDQMSGFGGPVYDREGNLAKDREIIAEYLDTADFDSLYRIHDRSGVVIIVEEEGVGSRPQSGNVVYANYKGFLLDGTLFDTNLEDVAIEYDVYNEERNYDIFTFYVDLPASQGGAIDGFSLGFKMLRSGAKASIIIPSPHAYQDNENVPRVPANSVLVFEVEFLGLD